MHKILILLISAALFAACSGAKKSSAKQTEVSLSDNYRTTKDGAILVDDRDFDNYRQKIIRSVDAAQQTPYAAADFSRVNTMTDGFGNRVETRTFDNHPLLSRITIRTTAAGQKKVFVYGKNGEVGDLPAEKLEAALTAPADELARSAGITSGREMAKVPYFLRSLQSSPADTSYVPATNYEFPSEPQLTEQSPAQTPPAENAPTETAVAAPAPPSVENAPQSETNYQSSINRLNLSSNKRREKKPLETTTNQHVEIGANREK